MWDLKQHTIRLTSTHSVHTVCGFKERFLIALTGERMLPSILTEKKLSSFVWAFFKLNRINSVLSGSNLSLFLERHFLTSSNQFCSLSNAWHAHV